LDRPPGLFLDDGSSFSNPAAGANIVTFELDEIAPSELAVDRKIEQGEVAFAVLQLKPARMDQTIRHPLFQGLLGVRITASRSA
jgi:hypothetical protein